MDTIECEGFIFTSNFDSANLARVELVPKKENGPSNLATDKSNSAEDMPDFEFNIWTKPDCAGTEFENFNRTWFYFGIQGGAPFALVKLNIVNLNKQSKMYSQGMAPVFRIVPGRSHWDRIKDKPTYTLDDNIFILSFKYRTLENLRATTYFAFTFPYSYTDLQNMLSNFDVRYNKAHASSSLDEIYYHRECVCHSLEGRRVDLITITSHHGMSSGREPRLRGLFPEENVLRPFNFLGKKVVFVSARVHPGETPSSFVFNGFLNMLLSRDDPISILLRKYYVFKLIPMLNPDGVANGHYRTDTRGVNLNRVYLEPSMTLHPSVFAARSLLCLYHHGREIDLEEKSECDISIFEAVAGCQQILNASVAAMSVESQTHGVKCEQNEDNSVKNDINRVSNIENQVSVLTLNDEESNPPPPTASNDIYTSIRETLLKNVLNACSLSDEKCNRIITAVGEGLPNNPLILEVQPIPHCSRQKEASTSESGTLPVSMFDITPTCLDAFSSGTISKDSIEGSSAKTADLQQSKPQAISVVGYGNVVTDPADSGLFLYVDLHGHASKKGIFMYGNHFENADDSVECMLLPRIMALNSQNFHFTACNFTERNMYLRDRRDGMSREGSGRVAVLKTTGLVRSYTLECNYNTGRLVNVLPPCVRDSGKQSLPLLVPPKYCPAVFEEVGKALGVSILDLTGSNPYSRIPNSEFHTISGIRDWLRQNCLPEQVYIHKMIQREKQVKRQESSAQVVGGPLRGASSSSISRPRARRVAPLRADSKIPVNSELAENSDRKENLSTFQITSGPQSPPITKGTKSCSESNENLGPSCSQRCVMKKVKGASSSVGGVLKQVLAVRTKCSVVGALTSSSKGKGLLLGTPTQRAPGLVNEVVQKKVVPQGCAGNRLTKFRKASSGEKQCKINVALCAFPDPVPVPALLPIGKKKMLSLVTQRKSNSDQVITKGTKRMKIAPVKSEQACSSGLMSESKLVTQTKAISEVKKLKGKGKKGKNTPSISNLQDITLDSIPNESDNKGDNMVNTWHLNQEATMLSAATTSRRNTLKKSKLSLRKTATPGNLAKCPSRTGSPKLEREQESSSFSTRSIKPERQGKSKIPHLVPLKGLQKSSSFVKRKSSELVKKRSKVSMRSLATSVSKFRVSTIDQTQAGTSDKKRKKFEPKLS